MIGLLSFMSLVKCLLYLQIAMPATKDSSSSTKCISDFKIPKIATKFKVSGFLISSQYVADISKGYINRELERVFASPRLTILVTPNVFQNA